MRVSGLHRPHHAHQGNTKQAEDSAQPAPICPASNQAVPRVARKLRQMPARFYG